MCICLFALRNYVTVHGTKNVNVLICVCVYGQTPPPPFWGKFLIYSKPIKVKEEMFYVTFKL